MNDFVNHWISAIKKAKMLYFHKYVYNEDQLWIEKYEKFSEYYLLAMYVKIKSLLVWIIIKLEINNKDV